jgi:hypothetical protein
MKNTKLENYGIGMMSADQLMTRCLADAVPKGDELFLIISQNTKNPDQLRGFTDCLHGWLEDYSEARNGN